MGASRIRRGPLGHLGAPWGPLGPLGPPWGPLGPVGPKSIAMGANKFENLPENRLLGSLGSKMGEKKVGIWAPGPPRRDPGRNSAYFAARNVQNGWMATHLVAKRCDLGSLGVPGPASTPLEKYSINLKYLINLKV